MRMRLSPPELKFYNASVYSLGQLEESWAVRRKALGMDSSSANYGSSPSPKHLWSGNQVMLSLTLRVLRFQLLF
jgi:hypothetical protein